MDDENLQDIQKNTFYITKFWKKNGETRMKYIRFGILYKTAEGMDQS